jgi:transposase InsO family protein
VAIELDTARFGSSATGSPWILARVDAAGTTHYQAGTNQAGTLLRIGKTVAGTFTELASLTRTAPAVGTQETWRFEIEGTTLRMYVNGVLEVTATDAIHRRGPWRSLEAVEYATLEWVDWFNNRRLLEPIGNIPPAEAEANFYAALETEPMAA